MEERRADLRRQHEDLRRTGNDLGKHEQAPKRSAALPDLWVPLDSLGL